MDFLAVIIAYLISISFSGHANLFMHSIERWRALVMRPNWGAKVSFILFALLPVVLFSCLLIWADSGLLTFVVSVGVLLLAFKIGDQPDRLADYQQRVEQDDAQGAWQLAVDELGLEGQMYEPGDDGLDEGVQAGISYLYLERFFVTLFWFVAFGAPGVVLVWLVSTLMKDPTVDAFSHQVKQALYWIPVRMMAFTLALMGSFAHCFPVWLEQAKDFNRDDRVLLVTCLKSALGEVSKDDLLDETLSLIKRAQLSWLVALAALLIFSVS